MGIFSLVLAAALAAPAGDTTPESGLQTSGVIRVTDTFDGAPFDYRMQLRAQKAGYRVFRLTYPSPVVTPLEQNNTVPADYYLPDRVEPGDPQRPAVICMHILDGDFELVEMMCTVLASRGIPAIMFKLPYYGERGPKEGPKALARDPGLFGEAIAQAMADVRRTVDLLAARPEIDPKRIGITGISLGGIVAATAAGSEPRIARAAFILAGGDLMQIIRHARETRDLRQMIDRLSGQRQAEVVRKIEAVDPLSHAAALRARAVDGKVLMINASVDDVIPPACTRKLADALGIAEKVIWLEGLGHYTAMAELPSALRTTAEFFAEDLPDGVDTTPRTVPEETPQQVLATLLKQAGGFLGSEPRDGRGHFAELELAATLADGKEITGRLRLVRGSKFKFRLEAEVPDFGRVAMGQGDVPWLLARDKAVFVGTIDRPAVPVDPLGLADEQNSMKLRMAAGALVGIAMVPDLLQRWTTITDGESADGRRAIGIELKDKAEGRLRLLMKEDGRTPERVTFDVEGVRGTLTFRGWRADTVVHDALFAPPGDVPVRPVKAADLTRVFSAMFNLAMEHAQ